MTFSAEASIPVADVSKQPLILLVLILGILTAFSAMSIDMYLPAFPQIARELGIPFSTVQLSISAFLFGSAAGQLFYGPLADRWGRRTPLLTGLTLYIVSAIGCACVSTDGELLFWRVVMAIGAGAGGVIARAVVRDLYNLTEAAKMFSMLMLVMGVAPILAPMVGGQILLFTGWRSIFGFLAIFGLLSLCLVAAKLPESLPEERRIRRSLSQMLTVYRHIFRNHQFLRYSIGLGCVTGVNFSYISGAPFVFIELHGVSPQHFGLFFGLGACGLIGASRLNRKLLLRYNPREILTLAFIINVMAAILLAISVITGIGGFHALVTLIFVCLAMTGLLLPNVTALAMAPFNKAAGSASALPGTIQYALGAMAGTLVGLLHNGTGLPMAATMAVCGLIGWVVTRDVKLYSHQSN
jgi:DHA1 family bicyclomycin/chloramphenicol resistance-like MFS transporter